MIDNFGFKILLWFFLGSTEMDVYQQESNSTLARHCKAKASQCCDPKSDLRLLFQPGRAISCYNKIQLMSFWKKSRITDINMLIHQRLGIFKVLNLNQPGPLCTCRIHEILFHQFSFLLSFHRKESIGEWARVFCSIYWSNNTTKKTRQRVRDRVTEGRWPNCPLRLLLYLR